MSEERTEPPLVSKPLEYWHSTERPINYLRLTLSCISGFVLGSVALLIIFGVSICGLMSIDAKKGNRIFLTVAAIFGACFFTSTIMFSLFSRSQRELSIEDRRKPYRFFQLGALIGFGLCALLAGLFLSVAGS